jgi:hypothetical protein
MPSNGERRKPLFSAEKKMEIMALVVGRPSGTVVNLGGLEIDIVAIPFAKDARITTLAQSIGELIDSAQKGGLSNFQDAAPLVVERYGEVKALLKEIVRDSVDVEDESVFTEWFEQLPMIPTIQTLLKATFDANGLTQMGNALAAATGAARTLAAVPPAQPAQGIPSPT